MSGEGDGIRSLPLVPVVLAGGSGTRLWPLSREGFPKQLLSLNGDRTLLQETVVHARNCATHRDIRRTVRVWIMKCHPIIKVVASIRLKEEIREHFDTDSGL